jgi:MtaA/CmuA family methyltransferase
MTCCERLLKRLENQPVDRIPNFNIMMTFAAHYIGEPLSYYYLDCDVLCRANFAVQQDFHLDIVQAISDPYRETADLGAEIEFPRDGLPICKAPLITDPAALFSLKIPAPENGRRMSDRLKAVQLFHDRVGGVIPVMGWVEGALAQAADLRGVNQVLLDMYDRADWLHHLLDKVCELEISFAVAQVNAGADIIGLGDAVASQISPAAYREFALPYEQRIFTAVHAAGGRCRLHICGDTTAVLDDMAASGADIIDIDWMVDMGKAASTFGDRAVVCGNQDPTAIMLQGTPDTVRTAVRNCMQQGGPRCLSAAGCEIPDNTPYENLHAQTDILLEMAR